jgi:hypothetical protein
MLTIRKKQIGAFLESNVKKFEERMIVHLNKFFPTQCKAAGETQLRETIRYGIKGAARYGIIAERDVCKYIDLMVVYGRDFDRDPKLPWASTILNDQTPKDPGLTVDRLYEEAMKNSRNRA